jgi:putative tricarboxylic transport membrane protein
MTATQVAYWDEVIQRVLHSDEWKKELETNFWSTDYMRSTDMRKFLERENTELRGFVADLGIVKYR